MANGIKAGVDPTPDPQPLKAGKAHWDEGKVKELLKKAPEEYTQEEALLVLRELDRRFMQLWDKVSFEREHKLVNYKLLKPTMIQNFIAWRKRRKVVKRAMKQSFKKG